MALVVDPEQLITRTHFGPFGAILKLRREAVEPPSHQPVCAHVNLLYRSLYIAGQDADSGGLPSLAPVHDVLRQRLRDLTEQPAPCIAGPQAALWLLGHFREWCPPALQEWGGYYALERVELGLVEAVGPAGAPSTGADRGAAGHEARVTWYSVDVPPAALTVLGRGRPAVQLDTWRRAHRNTYAKPPELLVSVAGKRGGARADAVRSLHKARIPELHVTDRPQPGADSGAAEPS